MNKSEAARLAKSIESSKLFSTKLCGEDNEHWLVLTPTIEDPERPWLWHEIRKPADWVRIVMSERIEQL
jgi:hypothetical protein